MQYQGESCDGEQHFQSAVDEKGAEQPQPVVSQVFEGQLEDVSPANAAKVNLLRRAIGRTTQHQELSAEAQKSILQMMHKWCLPKKIIFKIDDCQSSS